jgi:alpha-methylacyl-CoA racemase
VLTFAEAERHPHNVARGNFVPVDGSVPQLLPAPRLSRTPGGLRPTYAYPGCDTERVLSDFGLSSDEINALADDNVIAW